MAHTRTLHPNTIRNTLMAAPRDDENPYQLSWRDITAREREILMILESGASVGEIAARLQLSVGTVKSHLLHIYAKLAVHNRVQAVVLARRLHDEAKNHAIA